MARVIRLARERIGDKAEVVERKDPDGNHWYAVVVPGQGELARAGTLLELHNEVAKLGAPT